MLNLLHGKRMAIDKKFTQQMKKELEKEEARVKEELADFTVSTGKADADYETTFPQYGDKSGENATEVASFNNNVSLKNVLESTLRDVQSALKSIKKGTYGTCKYCKQAISQPRLNARPTSSSCIKCKKGFLGED